MMEFFDLRLIINTAIGTAIGGVVATFLFLPIVIAWLKKVSNWSGWKKIAVVFGPVVVIVLFIALLILISYLELVVQDGFAFSCSNECVLDEITVVNKCNEAGNLYANPETRIKMLRDKDLYSMLPENPPEPVYFYHGFHQKESPYPSDIRDLARQTFFGCTKKSGYVPHECAAGKLCYKIISTSFFDNDLGMPMSGRINGINVVHVKSSTGIDRSD